MSDQVIDLDSLPVPPMPAEKRIGQYKLPHILFKKIGAQYKDDNFTPVVSYFELPLDGCHCYEEKVQYYLKKGFKIVRYYIPESYEEKAFYKNALSPNGMTGILDASGEATEDKFAEVLALVKTVLEGDAQVAKLRAEVQDLKAQQAQPKNKPHVREPKDG